MTKIVIRYFPVTSIMINNVTSVFLTDGNMKKENKLAILMKITQVKIFFRRILKQNKKQFFSVKHEKDSQNEK